VILLLQIILILSGNLSFLNWLTIVPVLACFDDGLWKKILPKSLVNQAEKANEQAEYSRPMAITSWVMVCITGLLSIQPVFNMLSPAQIMNTSFDPLDLVNTYGAFGSVGKERMNVVYEGTMDSIADDHANWKAYPYKGLPVELDKRPPQIAPYQLRLDWQMWFAAMSRPEDYPWTINLVSNFYITIRMQSGFSQRIHFRISRPGSFAQSCTNTNSLILAMARDYGGKEKN